MPQEVNLGLGDLFKLGFDRTKIDFAKVDAGQAMILDGLEPAVTSPGNVDKWAFDALKSALHNLIEGLKAPAPLVVGATPVESHRPLHTREEVEAAITAAGGDPKKFAPWLLLVLQYAPQLVELILKLLGK